MKFEDSRFVVQYIFMVVRRSLQYVLWNCWEESKGVDRLEVEEGRVFEFVNTSPEMYSTCDLRISYFR